MMCERQRATFQKTLLEDGGKVQSVYSVNLTRIQVWTSVIVGFCTIVGMFVGGMMWLQVQAKEMVAHEFTEQLTVFHQEAKPAIANMIEEKIKTHTLIASIPFDGRLVKIQDRITALEVTVSLVVPDLKKSIDRNSEKLDRVLEIMAREK